MKNSERYHYHVSRFIDAVGQIEATHADALSRAKQYEGSAAHKDIIAEANDQRDAALTAERETAVKAIREIIDSMRQTARARKFGAPSQDQLAILQALKMRQKVNRDEIRQAENSLKDCPLALSVLDEIARDNGIIHTGQREAMTTDFVLAHIDCLERNAHAMIRGDNARFNRPPADLSDCLTRWGSFDYTVTTDEWGVQHAAIPSDTITAFCAAVDGVEGADT